MDVLTILQDLTQISYKPPSFKGGDDEDIDTFFQRYDEWSHFSRKSPFEKLRTLPFFFQDSAYLVYSALSEETKLNYCSVVKAMKEHYAKIDFSLMDKDGIFGLKMEMGESVQNYYSKLLTKARKSSVPQHFLMPFFIHGLTPSLKEYVLLKNPTDLKEALRLSKLKESVNLMTHKTTSDNVSLIVNAL